MMLTAILLLAIPVLGALLCLKGRLGDMARLNIVCLASILHLGLTVWRAMQNEASPHGDMAHLSNHAPVFLIITSMLFFIVSLHTRFWYPAELQSAESKENPGGLLRLPVFTASLLGFLAAMTLVFITTNLGLIWVAVEATTLASAPLILFHRSRRSLEAMWKYLLICSVGIGLALLGTMFLAVSANGVSLDFTTLQTMNANLTPGWYKAAFILVLVGYGTKMGLAPFHTWLPDAHSEAPGVVSALLSAALLNCSFFSIGLITELAPESCLGFCQTALRTLGMLSLAVAAFFIIAQDDFKRMLAYSSVEHMGLLALFLSEGMLEEMLFHCLGHSLIKMSLFLLAGNVLLACGTRQISRLGGLLRSLPGNGVLFIGGILLICGMPPSPLFWTEFALLKAAPAPIACAMALLLFLIFAGMTRNVHKLFMGTSREIVPGKELATAADNLIFLPGMALTLSLLAACSYFLFKMC